MDVKSRTRVYLFQKTSNPSSGEFQDRLIDGRPLYELSGRKKWWSGVLDCAGRRMYSKGSSCGCKPIRDEQKVAEAFYAAHLLLVRMYGAHGGQARQSDLKYRFNDDGFGAVVNSSWGLLLLYKKEAYAKFGSEHIWRSFHGRRCWI